MNRWSYCSSDEDEEHEEDANDEVGTNDASVSLNTNTMNDEQEENKTVVVENGVTEDINKPVEEKQEGGEDDDYEWEYFYEDVDVTANNKNEDKDKASKTKSPIPKRLEGLAKQTAISENKIGQVVNEGAIKISKDTPTPQIVTSPPQPGGPSGKTQRVNPRDGWECPTCTLLNEPKRPGCEACTTERPADYVIPPPGPADTIPRNPLFTKQEVANKDTPTLKVVAATVTKNEQATRGAVVTEGKVSSNN